MGVWYGIRFLIDAGQRAGGLLFFGEQEYDDAGPDFGG
jgi:hypothetical protein